MSNFDSYNPTSIELAIAEESSTYAENLLYYFYDKQLNELPEVHVAKIIGKGKTKKKIPMGTATARYKSGEDEAIVIDARMDSDGILMRMIDYGGTGLIRETFLLQESPEGIVEEPIDPIFMTDPTYRVAIQQNYQMVLESIYRELWPVPEH